MMLNIIYPMTSDTLCICFCNCWYISIAGRYNVNGDALEIVKFYMLNFPLSNHETPFLTVCRGAHRRQRGGSLSHRGTNWVTWGTRVHHWMTRAHLESTGCTLVTEVQHESLGAPPWVQVGKLLEIHRGSQKSSPRFSKTHRGWNSCWKFTRVHLNPVWVRFYRQNFPGAPLPSQ